MVISLHCNVSNVIAPILYRISLRWCSIVISITVADAFAAATVYFVHMQYAECRTQLAITTTRKYLLAMSK